MVLASVEVVKSLCRPDNRRSCIECCRRNCSLLGDTGDGKRGCLGYNGKIYEGITQPPFCQTVNCIGGETPEVVDKIAAAISKLNPGEFKMSQVLEFLNIKLH